MSTKKVVKVADSSRQVKVLVVDQHGETFACSHMPYMTALVFKMAWERGNPDTDRCIEIR